MKRTEIEGVLEAMLENEAREIEGVYVKKHAARGLAYRCRYQVQMDAGVLYCRSVESAARMVVKLRNAAEKG